MLLYEGVEIEQKQRKERERRNNQNGCHRMRIVLCDKRQANVKLEELGVVKSCGMAMEHKLSRAQWTVY